MGKTCGLNEKCVPRLMYLNMWSQLVMLSAEVVGLLEDTVLLEDVYHHSLFLLSLSLSLCFLCV